MNTTATATQTTLGKSRANGMSKVQALRAKVETPKVFSLDTMTNAQIVAMSTADVRANLRTLIDYSDSLLTRSSVIYALILTTAESMSMKPVPFFISAFSDVWPKSDKIEQDGTYPLLGLSTVEKAIRDEKLSLTDAQADAYRKVNAFKIWVARQKVQKEGEEGKAAPAKVLPRKVIEAIAKLRGLIDHAREVDVIEEIDGEETIVHEKVIAVADLAAIIDALAAL